MYSVRRNRRQIVAPIAIGVDRYIKSKIEIKESTKSKLISLSFYIFCFLLAVKKYTMVIKRREFLQVGSLATASFFVPKFLKAFETGTAVPPGNKVVVILQLSGGNDGLNTVVPVRNDIYYRNRPKLGIERNKAISLTAEVGLHPELGAFADAYHDGSM